MISFRQLEVFCAVMKNGSITKAAEQLGIAQPTVTKTIRRLEDYLGISLFNRTGGRLKPTTAARQVFEVTTPSMSAFERLSEAVIQLVRSNAPTFRMGVSPSVGQALGPRSLALFAAQNRKTRLRIDTLSMAQIRDYLWLAEGNCAVTIFPLDVMGISSFQISSVGMVCVVPVDHRLATNSSISITELDGEPLIFFHPNTPHGTLVRQIFRDAGIKPNISIETRFAETSSNLMREGFGLALQDGLTGLGVTDPNLKVLPLEETPRQPILFHCRADEESDTEIRGALECLRRAAHDLGLQDEFTEHEK